jgi:NhaP-type Na+/H+ or K+/H+ antiporter
MHHVLAIGVFNSAIDAMLLLLPRGVWPATCVLLPPMANDAVVLGVALSALWPGPIGGLAGCFVVPPVPVACLTLADPRR